jgi:hypothetical protein
MDTREAKRAARAWVESNHGRWPGLRAAHLVGSITSLPDGAPFPPYRDVDVILVVDPDSPALAAGDPFSNNIEEGHVGLMIEAGIKSIDDYRSPEAVLANPEIAHHLTVESALHDPDGILAPLQRRVRAGYAQRRWVRARLDHERTGFARAFGMRAMAGAMLGASGEANILGYTSTFVASALAVATLRAPTTGSRMLPRARAILAQEGRPDLDAALLAAYGPARIDPSRVAQYLEEAIEAFDLAVPVRRTPVPFGHKLHAHLRPYLVEACRSLLAGGQHREALHWLTPFYLASTDIILADGPEALRERFADRRAAFLADLDLDTEAVRTAHFEAVERVAAEVFALASRMIERDPAIAA